MNIEHLRFLRKGVFVTLVEDASSYPIKYYVKECNNNWREVGTDKKKAIEYYQYLCRKVNAEHNSVNRFIKQSDPFKKLKNIKIF